MIKFNDTCASKSNFSYKRSQTVENCHQAELSSRGVTRTAQASGSDFRIARRSRSVLLQRQGHRQASSLRRHLPVRLWNDVKTHLKPELGHSGQRSLTVSKRSNSQVGARNHVTRNRRVPRLCVKSVKNETHGAYFPKSALYPFNRWSVFRDLKELQSKSI